MIVLERLLASMKQVLWTTHAAATFVRPGRMSGMCPR